MKNIDLARLQKVDLRDVWANEALDFTNWLANEENLELLGNEIGIELSLIKTEYKIGAFNVDILAEESGTNEKVIIENQLERTDHDHLGKVITYASGVDAKYIIWIVKRVRDEHKRAIDWLNEHTDSEINIFAIEMEVWKIANSPGAPKFNIVAKPNEWAKEIRRSSRDESLSEIQLLQLEFWTEFQIFGQKETDVLSFRKTRPRHWYDISMGSSEAHIALTVNSQKNFMSCDFYIRDSDELFNSLIDQRDSIEKELGEKLEWLERPTKKASRIRLTCDCILVERENWQEYHGWLLKKALAFFRVFRKYMGL